jgi:S1-C subfamily serine protease
MKHYLSTLTLLVLSGCLCVFHGAVYAQNDIQQIKNSVVKIYTTAVVPDTEAPWQSLSPGQRTGSGVVIAKNRILTNAHVVADAKYIQVQKHNDPNKYLAEVSFVSHYADLALVKVKDPVFFKDLKPLAIGQLPPLYQEVAVFGYPVGGETLSVTKGVLSRVEQKVYLHEGSYLLAGQIDAAINPGNSGGPVIVNSKIVGIVMQMFASNETMNLGYFIPPVIIQHVLKDSEDGKNDGFPELGFRTQNLENPAAKTVYGLKKGQSGVLVVKVFEGSAAAGKLQKNDVILKIDDYTILGNSTINYNPNLKVDLQHAIDRHFVGDKVQITYLRGGKIQKTTLIGQKTDSRYELVPPSQFDKPAPYYIYAGIVFVPFNATMLTSLDCSTYNLDNQLWQTPAQKQLVAVLSVLPADVNFGYHDLRYWIVNSVNGQPVKDFLQFARMLEHNKAPNVIFENGSGYQIIINHAEAKKSEADIFELYKVSARHSEGLLSKAAQ